MTAANAPALLRHLCRLVAPREMEQASDRQLLARYARRGEEAAFAELLRRHGPAVLGVCRRVLRHEQDAEDAFQAAFLILARKAGSLRQPDALAAWLHGVAFLVARQARDRRRVPPTNLVAPPEALASEQPFEQASWREMCQLLDEELQRLPPRCRAVLVLCYLQGLTRDEAARRLGWSLATLKRRLERGRRLLHVRLMRRGVAPAGLALAALTPEGLTAALPAGLVQATVRTVQGSRTGEGVSTAIATLAKGVAQTMWLGKIKMMAATAMMLLAVLAAGGGLAIPRAEVEKASPQPPSSPVAQDDAKRARTDRFGDPLPPGALARLGTIQQRFNGWALAWTSDGRTLVACNRERSFRWWDARTGKLKKSQDWPGSQWRRVHLSPDGQTLATESWEGEKGILTLWDVESGKRLHRYPDYRWNGDYPFAFSPDSCALVVANCDLGRAGILQHFDLATGNRRDVGKHTGVMCLAISPNGKRLVSGGSDFTIHCWNIATGKEVWRINQWNLTLSLSPDGRLLAIPHGNTVRLHDAATGKLIEHTRLPELAYLQNVHFSSKGDCLAVWGTSVTNGATETAIWDLKTGKERFRVPAYIIRFSPDGETLAGFDGSTLQCWDMTTGKPIYSDTARMGHTRPPLVMAYSPDGKLLASAAWYDSTVRLWDVATSRVLHTLPDAARFSCFVLFTPDGKQLITADWKSGIIRFWDVGTGQEIRHWALRNPAGKEPIGELHRLYLSRDGKTLSTITYTPPEVPCGGRPGVSKLTQWDAGMGKPLSKPARVPTRCAPDDTLKFSPDGRVFRIDQKEIREVTQGDTPLAPPSEHLIGEAPGTGLTFSADGALVAASLFSYKERDSVGQVVHGIQVWELATGRPVVRLPAKEFAHLAISPDGRILAATSSDEIRAWDIVTGKEVYRQPVQSHLLGMEGCPLIFAPDGRTLATALQDTTITIWDLSSIRRAVASKPPLSADQQDALWSDLISQDAARAYAAIGELTARPEQAIALFRTRLSTAAPVPEESLRRLLADLDSEDFARREAASRRLTELGPQADAALRKTLDKQPSLEMRKRIEILLSERSALSPQALRGLRSVRVLEQIGSASAREVLKRLANGTPHAQLADAAQAALQRLARR